MVEHLNQLITPSILYRWNISSRLSNSSKMFPQYYMHSAFKSAIWSIFLPQSIIACVISPPLHLFLIHLPSDIFLMPPSSHMLLFINKQSFIKTVLSYTFCFINNSLNGVSSIISKRRTSFHKVTRDRKNKYKHQGHAANTCVS